MGSTTIKRIDRIESNASGDIVVAPGSGKFEVESTYIEADNIKNNNLAAILDPAVTNDDSENYSIGSQWTNTLSGARFQATDVSTGAAVWLSIGGGGGGGGVDSYLNENFESKDSGDFTTGNNATFLNGGSFNGTLDEETGSPIEGDQSIRDTQAASSLNDWIAFENTDVGLQQRGKTNTFVMFAQYDGDDDDIEIVIWDATNSIQLSSGQFIKGTGTGPSKRYEIKFSMPLTTSIINVGLHVKVENIGAICIFDLFELNTDPFVNTSIVTENIFSARIANNGSATITSQSSQFITSVNRTGAGNVTVTFDTDFFSVIPMIVSMGTNDTGFSAENIAATSLTAASVIIHTDQNGAATDLDFDIILQNQGSDYVGPQDAIISNLTEGANWTDFVPTFVGLGTVASLRAQWKQDGDSIRIQGSLIAGTVSASQVTMTMPNNYEIDGVILSSAGNRNSIGSAQRVVSGNTTNSANNQAHWVYDGSDQTLAFLCRDTDTNTTFQKSLGTGWLNTGEAMTFDLYIPIEGLNIENSVTVLQPILRTAYIIDEKADDVAGGTGTASAWTTRDLNKIESGSTDFFTLDSDQLTISPGIINIEATSPFKGADHARIRIRDITNGVTIAISTTVTAGANQNAIPVPVNAQVNINEATIYEIQYLINQTISTEDLGAADTTSTEVETYTRVKLEKVK